MTIKQLGGVFGRNPTFNDVTIEGTLTFDGDIDITSDLTIEDNLYVLGSVGIGEVSPATALHLKSADPVIRLEDSNPDGVYAQIDGAGGSLILSADQGNGSANSNIVFKSDNIERMRINSSGNVGINTTDIGANLSVRGDASTGVINVLDVGNPQNTATTGDGARIRLHCTSDENRGVAIGSYSETNYAVDNSMLFYTSASSTLSEKMRIDSSGNVGINTIPKAWTAFNPVLQIKNASTGGGGALAGTSADNFRMFANTYYDGAYKKLAAGFATQYAQESGTHVWSYAATGAADSTFTWSEAMRLDSSGNFLVGTTATPNTLLGASATQGLAFNGSSGYLVAAASGQATAYFNRQTSDGTIADFRKDGTSVGSIGVTDGDLNIYSSASSHGGLRFGNGWVAPTDNAGTLSDGAIDLGLSSGRFQDIWATNGTIQTSDRNEKQDIESLSEAEQRVAVAVKGLLRKFRWKSAVEEKGENARIHFGIIAQDLQAAFEAEGLDAGRYGMFINSTWTDEETGEERSRMGVRYSELLAFIIAAI